MEIPPSEIIDRYTIARLKLERLTDAQIGNRASLENEFAAYGREIDALRKRGVTIKQEWIDALYDINGRCWDYEAAIHQGREGLLGLEEVGKRALLIRGVNRERVAVKNLVVKETGIGFCDVKINHASAEA